MSRRRFAASIGGALLAAEATWNARASTSGDRRRAVERILRGLVERGAVPGISYSIGTARGILAEGAFGLRALRPAAPMTPATRCPLASVSKQFASAALYLLQQRGEISLQEPLSTYLPEYRYAGTMTLAQVLTMRSGIPADTQRCEAPIDGRFDGTTLIAHLNEERLDFPPGSRFAYSNCGYDLAGVVVERVSRMPYGAFLDRYFFKPLGMRSSYVLGSRSDSNFAQGYAREGGRWKSEPATAADAAFASGDLVSTTGDLQRWNRSLFDASILSRRSLRQMFAVPPGSSTRYASGWFVDPNGTIWHSGTLGGYGTANLLVRATGYAIVLLGNAAPSDAWNPAAVAHALYNAANLAGTTAKPLL